MLNAGKECFAGANSFDSVGGRVLELSRASSSDIRYDPISDCGVRPIRGQGRIVGGKASTFGDWPWQVLVKESTWLGLFTKNKCGGVLISNKHVLTAAHCQPG